MKCPDGNLHTDLENPSGVGAILPVAAKDFARAELLLQTVSAFGLGVAGIQCVVPGAKQSEAEARLQRDDRISVIAQEDLLEGGIFSRVRRMLAAVVGRDWYLQQLLKIVLTARTEREFCLVLDADCLLTRHVSERDILPDGRAPAVNLRAMRQPKPYQASADLLSVEPLTESFGVTPAVLHTQTCRAILERIDELHGSGTDKLFRSVGWTEYALYYTWAAHSGSLQDHHFEVGYDDWFAPSIWEAKDWESWDPSRWFGSASAAPFCVVQSHLGLPIDAVRDRLGLPRPL